MSSLSQSGFLQSSIKFHPKHFPLIIQICSLDPELPTLKAVSIHWMSIACRIQNKFLSMVNLVLHNPRPYSTPLLPCAQTLYNSFLCSTCLLAFGHNISFHILSNDFTWLYHSLYNAAKYYLLKESFLDLLTPTLRICLSQNF